MKGSGPSMCMFLAGCASFLGGIGAGSGRRQALVGAEGCGVWSAIFSTACVRLGAGAGRGGLVRCELCAFAAMCKGYGLLVVRGLWALG